MSDNTERSITDQLDLIEGLILEGRRSMENWGWMFVMWGVGHAAALIWSRLWTSNPGMPWAILMTACGIGAGIGAARAARRRGKSTVMGRAQGAAWAAFTISLVILWIVGAITGTLDVNNIDFFYAIFFALIGGANFTSGVTVRLHVQTAVALLWWGSALIVLLLPGSAEGALLLRALVGEICFGIYLMALERKGETPPARAA